jgi:DNA replication and repair protein RecF
MAGARRPTVLKQRTALLKSARARGIRGDALSTLDVWDDKLVAARHRRDPRATRPRGDLAGPVAAAYTAIAGCRPSAELEWALSIGGADPDDDVDAAATGSRLADATRRRSSGRGDPGAVPCRARRNARPSSNEG